MIHWNASPEIIALGPLQIRWYGLLFAMGFLAGYRMMFKICEREKISTEHLDSLLVYMMVGTVVGARLGHCLIYEPEIYLNDPIRIFKVWEGGLASHGGALGVMLGTWFWKRRHFQGSFLNLVDYLCVPSALVSAMIRLGNFFNSEIIGKPTDVPWAVVFQRVDHLPRHPSQLYESISYLITFGVLSWTLFSGRYQRRRGLLLGIFFTMIFTARFFIEFLKEPQVGYESQLPLDLGQLLSIPFVLCGLFLIYRALRMPVAAPA
ncbi:MAG: prolipoprotein diacylglyceryl transferase, partial [Bdellovibrionia bacterium]